MNRTPDPFSSPRRGARWAGAALLLALFLAGCDGDGETAAASANPAPGTATPPPGTPTPPPPPGRPAPVADTFFFGAQTHFAQGWGTDVVPRLAAGGITTVRDELYWQMVEPTPGNFKFPASYDAYMAALTAARVTPLIELDFENPNYDGGQTPYTAAGFAAYARYATAVLQHYPQIGAVEIWNEFNGSFNRGPATLDRAGTYLGMLRTAAEAIRAKRPDVTIVGGATAGVPLPYFEKLFASGALESMDVVSIHPYRFFQPPEGIELQVTALQALIARYGRGADKPVWVTEIGWSTHPPAAPGDLAIDETTQAKFLTRACALLASAGVERVYWYLFRDDGPTPTMGLVRNDAALTPKPALTALRAINTQLQGATFVAREQTAPGVYSLRFINSAQQELRILWSLSPFSVAVPGGTSVTDLFGSAVAGSTLTVTDSPVFVTGPLPALAGANTAKTITTLADSAAGFSDQQGAFGWRYGVFLDSGFVPLPTVRTTDWQEEWIGPYGPVSITETDQHPGGAGNASVAVVRRWVSNYSGPVHVSGRFQLVSTQGDGVRVHVLVDNQFAYSATLSARTSIAGSFDFSLPIQSGSTIDFVVDPGAAGNLDFDATLVSATIETTQP